MKIIYLFIYKAHVTFVYVFVWFPWSLLLLMLDAEYVCRDFVVQTSFCDPHWSPIPHPANRSALTLFLLLISLKDSMGIEHQRFYHPPTKLRVGNLFSPVSVCQSIYSEGVLVEGTSPSPLSVQDPLNMFKLVQLAPYYTGPNTKTCWGCHLTPPPPQPGHIQTCSLWSMACRKAGGCSCSKCV